MRKSTISKRKLIFAAGAAFITISSEKSAQAISLFGEHGTRTNTVNSQADDDTYGLSSGVTVKNTPNGNTAIANASDQPRDLTSEVFVNSTNQSHTTGAAALESQRGLGSGIITSTTQSTNRSGAIAFETKRGLSTGVFTSETITNPTFGTGGLWGSAGLPSIETAKAEAFETPEGLSAGIFIGPGKTPAAVANVPFSVSSPSGSNSLDNVFSLLSGATANPAPINQTAAAPVNNSSPIQQAGTLLINTALKAYNSVTGSLVLTTDVKALGAGTFNTNGTTINTAGAGIAESSVKLYGTTGQLVVAASQKSLGAGSFSTDGTNITTAGAGVSESGAKVFVPANGLVIEANQRSMGSGTFSNEGANIATAGAGATQSQTGLYSADGTLAAGTNLKALGAGTFSNQGSSINTAGAGAVDASIFSVFGSTGTGGYNISIPTDQTLIWGIDLQITGTGVFADSTTSLQQVRRTGTLAQLLETLNLPSLFPGGMTPPQGGAAQTPGATGNWNGIMQNINNPDSFLKGFGLSSNDLDIENWEDALQALNIPGSTSETSWMSALGILTSANLPDLSTGIPGIPSSGNGGAAAVTANLKALGAGTFSNRGNKTFAAGAGAVDADSILFDSNGRVIKRSSQESAGSNTSTNARPRPPRPDEPPVSVPEPTSTGSLIILGALSSGGAWLKRKRKRLRAKLAKAGM